MQHLIIEYTKAHSKHSYTQRDAATHRAQYRNTTIHGETHKHRNDCYTLTAKYATT